MRERDLDVARVALELGRRNPSIVSIDVAMLLSVATSLHRLSMIACERELTDKEWQRSKRLRRQAHDIAVGMWGAQTVFLQSDPRGCPLYVIFHGDIPEGGDVEDHYHKGVAIPG